MMRANGCEANFQSDAKNCGQCGAACGNNAVCVNGGCTAACNGWTPLVIGGVLFCYSNQPGTCQQAHQFCEALGNGYRLMCGDDWNSGRDGKGCGGGGSYTAYDIVNKFFPGNTAIGSWNNAAYDCVSGGQNGQCGGDVGNQAATNMNGKYAFCAPKNYYKNPPDGQDFANFCGN